MSNYTRGPWIQAGPSFGLGKMQYTTDIHVEFVDGSGECSDEFPVICHMPGIDCHDEEHEANAALIAASPDLLEALEMLVASFGETPSEKVEGLAEARSAIKKAKGES